MYKQTRQEFSIKVCPTNEIQLLETTLNTMAKEGWDLYSIYEAEAGSKLVYNCLFIREVENLKLDSDFEDIDSFKSRMEKMLYSKEQPYELCLNIQKKIIEKRLKINEIKNFLENAKEDEREFLNEEISVEIEKLNSLKKQLKSILSPSIMEQNLGEEKLSINLSQELCPLINSENEENMLAQSVKVRQDLVEELGYIIPKVRLNEDASLDENEFSILVHAVPVETFYAYSEHLMFFEEDLNIEKYPKNTIKLVDKLTNRKIVWIEKEHCKDFWTKGISASEYIGHYLKHHSITNVHDILSYNDMNRYIELVSEHNSYLVDAILGDFVSVPELKYIFANLIRERVSVKNVINIFEKLNDFSDDSTKTDLLDKLRISISDQICYALANPEDQIFGYELSEDIVEMLESQMASDDSGVVKIDGSKFDKFKSKLQELVEKERFVLVAPSHLRQMLFVLISQIFIDITVISLEEVSPRFELKILGEI